MDGFVSGKNVLYLSYDGMTDPLGQSQVLPYLVGLKAEYGHRFTLVSFEKPDAYARGRTVIEDICAKHGIRWEPQTYTRRPPVISTIKDIRRMGAAARALQRETPGGFDLVHCRSYISALIGLHMKRTLGTPLLFDMRGFWPDERVDGGQWNLSNPLYRQIYQYFKRKERQFLQEADATVSLTHEGKREIERWGLPGQSPVSVIPCCVDTRLFDPAAVPTGDRESRREALRIPPGHEVVGYVGSVGSWYLVSEMLDFFKTWLAARPKSILLFVSNEPEDVLRRHAGSAALDWDAIRVVRSPRAEVPAYIAAIDYGLFFIKPVFSKKASSPVKQGELMAMGVPVVCNSGVGDTDNIVERYDAGVLVRDFSEKGYSAALEAITSAAFDHEKIRSGARDYFGLDKGVAAYHAVYAAMRRIS